MCVCVCVLSSLLLFFVSVFVGLSCLLRCRLSKSKFLYRCCCSSRCCIALERDTIHPLGQTIRSRRALHANLAVDDLRCFAAPRTSSLPPPCSQFPFTPLDLSTTAAANRSAPWWQRNNLIALAEGCSRSTGKACPFPPRAVQECSGS